MKGESLKNVQVAISAEWKYIVICIMKHQKYPLSVTAVPKKCQELTLR